MESHPQVIVVGGGIEGCAVAMEVALRGGTVSLVERNQPGVGATGASAGILAPQYEAYQPDSAFWLGVRSRELWPAFNQRLQQLTSWETGFRTDGMLVANHSDQEENQASQALAFQASAGLPGEILSASEARRFHGAVSAEVRSWTWMPGAGQVDTQRLAVCLADAVRGAGAALIRGVEVCGLTSEGGRVSGVRFGDGGGLAGEKVVLAAGAWCRAVRGLPRGFPVRPVRGQMLRLIPATPLPWVMVGDHQGRYLVPRANGTVLAGSTMEDVGYDDRVTEEGRAVLSETAASLVPDLGEARIVEEWAGFRPITEDRRPILGPDPDVEGLFYSTGHGRAGILLAPLSGRMVADLVLEKKPEVDWEPFGIQRFGSGPPQGTRQSPPAGRSG